MRDFELHFIFGLWFGLFGISKYNYADGSSVYVLFRTVHFFNTLNIESRTVILRDIDGERLIIWLFIFEYMRYMHSARVILSRQFKMFILSLKHVSVGDLKLLEVIMIIILISIFLQVVVKYDDC